MARLCLRHTHTLPRWTKVWNLLLPKAPPDNRIHRHRVIHIQEADYQLLSKKLIARDLMRHAETHGTLADEVWAGRKGRQATDVAWLASLLTSQIHHDQQPACIFFNDLASCYDRIVEPVSIMSLRSRGCDPKILALHSQTQQLQQYFVVTGHGESDLYNQHSTQHPFGGSSQGTGDSPARWYTLSSDVIQAYRQPTTPFLFHHRPASFSLAAYVDDTFTAANVPHGSPPAALLTLAARHTRRWADLIHCTGGKLELPKCSCYVFRWHTDSNNQPALVEDCTDVRLLVPDTTGGRDVHIPTPNLDSTYKHMGIAYSPTQSTSI